MSLNKFTSTQLGKDLELKIGCDELDAQLITSTNALLTNVNVIDFVRSQRLEAEVLTTLTLEFNGVQFDPLANKLHTVGMATQNVGGTAVETSLFPAQYLGPADGEFKADELVIGDVVSIDSYLKIQSSPTGVIQIRLYAGDGFTTVIAETDAVLASAFSSLVLAKMNISVSIRDTDVCHIDGVFSVFNADGSTLSYPIRQKQTLLDITVVNKLALKAQWVSGDAGSLLSMRQLTYKRTSVA